MKVLVILSAVLASCLAYPPSIGYAYSAISPLTAYSSIAAPYSYAYSAPIISAPLAVPLAAPLAAPVAPIAPVAAAAKTQYHAQDELGQAKYGHSEPLQAHTAVQDAHGNKIGSFSYVDPHGAVHQTNYIADGAGYRVTSNDLPVAPAAPLLALHRRRRQASWNGPIASPVVTPTGHLAETPEVAAAKAAHFAEHARQYSTQGAAPAQQSWSQARAQPDWNAAPTAYSSWNQPQAAPAQQWNQQQTQSWNQPQTQSWNQAQARGWAQPQATPTWSQPQSTWSQTPAQSAPIADAPDVAAAKAAHFSEYSRVVSAAQAAAAQVAASDRQSQAEDDGSYRPEYQSEGVPAAPSATAYSSWNQPQAQAWNQPQTQAWNQPQAQAWNQPQAAAAPVATAYSSWNQPQAASQSWSQSSPWGQSPSGGIPDTPEVAAAKAAHLAEHAAASRRSKRSTLYQTPASTAPLAVPIIPAPLTYSAPTPIAQAAPAPIAYSAPAFGVPAIRTDIVHTPGHAVSYKIEKAIY